jgi:two-component sensor histidine kinase
MPANHSQPDAMTDDWRLPGGRKLGTPALQTPNVLAGAWLAVGELNHRVANEYSAAIAWLSIATTRVANPEAKAALIGAASRLRDFAEVHRALQPPMTGEPVSLAEYLRRLCAALIRTKLAERNIGLRLVEHDIDLDAQQC